MPTNKIILKTADEYMNDYKPIYKPIYPLFLNGARKYVESVGQLKLKRVEALGDLDANFILPKDTEMKQLHATETEKTFKKYFKAIQYIQSGLQSSEDANSVVNQVLDRHHIQFDKMLLEGEGTSDSTVLNNGLFWSGDDNHTTESSAEISATDTLYKFHEKILSLAEAANANAGRKLVMFYGDNIEKANSLFPDVAVPFIKILKETLGPDYSVAMMPSACTPTSANGFEIINIDQIKVHYIKIPMVDRDGFNEEKNYYWWNFFLGSIMVECLAPKAIIKQPVTWA